MEENGPIRAMLGEFIAAGSSGCVYFKNNDSNRVVKIVLDEDYKNEMEFYHYVKTEKIPTPFIYERDTLSEGKFKAIVKEYVKGKTLRQYFETHPKDCEEIPDRKGLDNLLNTLFKDIESFANHGKGIFIVDPHPRNIMYDLKQSKWVIVDGNLWDSMESQDTFEYYMKFLIFTSYNKDDYNLLQKCDLTAGAYLMKIWKKIENKSGGEAR
jgi:hypothetical protein